MYLESYLTYDEHIQLHIKMIPLHFERAYNRYEISDENGYVYVRISISWYDLKHSVKIDHNNLLKISS